MNKQRRPAVESDYAKAIKHVQTLKGQNSSLTAQLEAARRERDVAERAARSLTHELQAARRELAELRSLAPHPKGN